jgi:TatD DNase family protein
MVTGRTGPERLMLVDTHCHLTHERYRDDLPEMLAASLRAGTSVVISVASDLTDAADARALAERFAGAPDAPRIFTTAGVHPHEAGRAPRDLMERLRAFVAADSGTVAIGECGLDYHYDFAPRPEQRRVFDQQLELAAGMGLPVVVHCREAEADMIPLVAEAGRAGVRGVLHCFPGDLELLEAALEAGWNVSFTGMVTFRSFAGSEAVIRVPKDRYMLETDGPYMAPVPHRGKRSDPGHIHLIRDRIAEMRGEPADEVAAATTRTAEAFFGL